MYAMPRFSSYVITGLWDIISRQDANNRTVRVKESYADLRNKFDLRTRDLTDTLEQQTTTADILRVINSSPTHLA